MNRRMSGLPTGDSNYDTWGERMYATVSAPPLQSFLNHRLKIGTNSRFMHLEVRKKRQQFELINTFITLFCEYFTENFSPLNSMAYKKEMKVLSNINFWFSVPTVFDYNMIVQLVIWITSHAIVLEIKYPTLQWTSGIAFMFTTSSLKPQDLVKNKKNLKNAYKRTRNNVLCHSGAIN